MLPLLVCLSLLASGCATVTTRAFQTIAVTTEPDGADCTFSGDGQPVARIAHTPGAVLVAKAARSITVLCRKEGYQDLVAATPADLQPMALGNVLMGGIVGLVVDAGSGALMKYPDAVTFVLAPLVYASAIERDAFFADLVAACLADHERLVIRIEGACASEDCAAQIQAAGRGRNARLAAIEQQRRQARIRGT